MALRWPVVRDDHQLTQTDLLDSHWHIKLPSTMIPLRCSLLLLLFVSVSYIIGLPTCSLSYWLKADNTSCSELPDRTYVALNYNGQCTAVPNDPGKTFYQLLIDTESSTVHKFAVYQTAECHPMDLLFNTTLPVGLDTCQPLYFVNSGHSFFTVGNLLFRCRD